jgi:hypothetical protein
MFWLSRRLFAAAASNFRSRNRDTFFAAFFTVSLYLLSFLASNAVAKALFLVDRLPFSQLKSVLWVR